MDSLKSIIKKYVYNKTNETIMNNSLLREIIIGAMIEEETYKQKLEQKMIHFFSSYRIPIITNKVEEEILKRGWLT